MNNLEFALEMKNKRLASGLSQGELASLTHVSRYSINRFENGKANASKEMILSILVDTFISKISFPMQPGPEIGSISDA